MIRIGDFVTSCSAGYWQLIDIKPKIADSDYSGEKAKWKKGDVIGQWAILKKSFTPKMKPRIDFEYVDFSWLAPVSGDVLRDINLYFSEHPDYKSKFDGAEVKLSPTIVNCWIELPEEAEEEFQSVISKLPVQYTMDEFWKIAKKYKKFVSNPPANHLLNFFTYPWAMDKKANLIYHGVELVKQ